MAEIMPPEKPEKRSSAKTSSHSAGPGFSHQQYNGTPPLRTFQVSPWPPIWEGQKRFKVPQDTESQRCLARRVREVFTELGPTYIKLGPTGRDW